MPRDEFRVPYKEAAVRARLSRQRLLDSEELSGLVRAWRLWAVCIELTASYSKSADRVNVTTLANMADMRVDKASKLLRDFDRLGILIWRKDARSHRKGFLALPSWKEPDAEPKPREAATPKRCPECGESDIQYGQVSFGPDTAHLRQGIKAWMCWSCGHEWGLTPA